MDIFVRNVKNRKVWSLKGQWRTEYKKENRKKYKNNVNPKGKLMKNVQLLLEIVWNEQRMLTHDYAVVTKDLLWTYVGINFYL